MGGCIGRRSVGTRVVRVAGRRIATIENMVQKMPVLYVDGRVFVFIYVHAEILFVSICMGLRYPLSICVYLCVRSVPTETCISK